MENFKRDISTIVHAELHGFRFNQDSNGGVDDVTISCIVKICTGSSDECADVSIIWILFPGNLQTLKIWILNSHISFQSIWIEMSKTKIL